MGKKSSKIGAVAVIGGGITGVQASLDLADMGFKVYLIEKTPAIGGIMAKLDKTFPTNDCSMCILSPKLVDCGRHENIEIITNTEVQGIEGKPGNLFVNALKKPRYVDLELCTSCGDCAEACPISLPNEFDHGFSERKAIYKYYPQAIPNAYIIDKEFSLDRLVNLMDESKQTKENLNNFKLNNIDFIVVDNISNLITPTTKEVNTKRSIIIPG